LTKKSPRKKKGAVPVTGKKKLTQPVGGFPKKNLDEPGEL